MKLSSLTRNKSFSKLFSIGRTKSVLIFMFMLIVICDFLSLVPAAKPVSVSISPTQAVLDVGQAQLFTSTVSGGTSPYAYQWYLNGASVSGATSAVWTFSPAAAGSYTLYVVVTDSSSGNHTTAQSNIAPVTVNSALSASISPSSAVLDVDQSKLFASSVSGGTSPYSYQWYLNGALISGATDTTWTFTPNSAGSYSAYLKVTDNVAQQATSNTAAVTVNGAPSISISPTSVAMDAGQSQLFTSSVSGGTSPYTYQWYLNSVSVSGATKSSWTFTPSSHGSYNVYLQVLDAVSAVATSNTAVATVNSALSVMISPGSVSLGAGQSQLFTSSVSGGTPTYSYHWYLNGLLVSGATSSKWTFTPSSPGSNNVYVSVTDNVGSTAASNTASVTVNPALIPPVAQFTESANEVYTGTLVQFNASFSYDPDGTIISYYWDFGDGKNATGEVTSHSYAEDGNYTVALTVTDNDGLSDTQEDTILIQDRTPSASFTVSSTTAYTNETVTFNATSSYDPDGLILSYFWDFGDGTNATDIITSHAYTHEGVYTVSLTVTDDDNNTDSAVSTENILSHGTTNQPPIAIFTVSAQNVYVGDSLGFNASASYDPDGTITSYFWEFGDQTNSTGVTVSHQYSQPGNYTVKLTVSDNGGSSNVTSLNVNIISWSTVASFTIFPSHPSPGDLVTFNSSGSYDLNGTIETYRWNFGDGNTSETTAIIITHSYQAPGDFNVTLTVFSNQGHNASATQQISLQIHDVAVINVTLSTTEVQVGQTVNVTVEIRNKGTAPESFGVTLFRNETVIASQQVANLRPGEEQNLLFCWNTSDIQDGGIFLLRAKADNVTGETALSDNIGVGALVSVLQGQNKGSSSTSGFDWKWTLPIAPVTVLLSLALMWRRRNGAGKVIGFEHFIEITNGGIPDSSSILVTGGPGSGKSVLCQELVYVFLTQKKSCLYVTYDCFPDEVLDNVRKIHSDLSTLDAEKRLQFVDCFSASPKNKDKDYYLGQSFSLADLGIVLSEATSDLGPSLKIVLDSITPLMTHIEPLKVVEFLQDRSARIKGVGGTFIFTMGKAIVEPSLSNRLEETVDGVIELDESVNKGKTVRRLRVKKMRGKQTSDKWVQFEIDPAKGIVFST
jgi:PKD repeat protein/KaiC/GvpD/RAD55 family RecA-like ATPase